jgi:PPM family protein phosphatase
VAKSLSDALEFVVRTDAGIVRGHNEDAVFANPNQGLAILADGMGGYNAGEVASSMATTLLATEFEAAFETTAPCAIDAETGQSFAHRCIVEKIGATNRAILHAAESQPQYAGMGTTLVLALFHDNLVTVAHIGDSRLYRLRGGTLEAITRDHSLLQEQIDSGLISVDEARHAQNRNLVTRALGVDPEVNAEIHDYAVLPGDLYLLCSDGLNDMVEDDEIHLILQTCGARLERAAQQLIQAANEHGGRDNVSVILVKVLREFPVAGSWWSKLVACFK